MDFHNVGLQVIQQQVAVDDLLQFLKQRAVLVGVVRLHRAGLVVAGDLDALLAEDVVGGIDLGVHLGAVLFQVLAETLIRSRSSRLAETRVQKMRHVFAFDLCHWLSPHFFT